MKVAVYTLTRDRLRFTKHCFGKLRELAGCEFDHFVFDNGSTDGTLNWLASYDCTYRATTPNIGISRGQNRILREVILPHPAHYEIIVKLDNDAEAVTPNFLARCVKVVEADPMIVVSPRVEGIDHPLGRGAPGELAGERLGFHHHFGGIMRVSRREPLEKFRWDDNSHICIGQDVAFSNWLHAYDYRMAYLEDVVVNHYLTTRGQKEGKDVKDYYERKFEEQGQGWKNV